MPDRTEDTWADARLLKTSLEFFGAGDDVGQPSGIRFLRGVARLIKKRLRKEIPPVDAAPAVFLLLPSPPPSLVDAKLEQHPMLDNGLTAVEGRIWLVGPLVNHGRCMPLVAESDADLFELLISVLGLGNVPAVVFDPRTDERELRYYRSGLEDIDQCEIVSVLHGAVSLEDVFQIIDRVYEKKLVTPDAQSVPAPLWADSEKHWPVDNAEVRVQMYLDTALHIAFPWCRITGEQPGINGRTDLEVEEIDPTTKRIIKHVLLELKVLRDFGSTGRPKSAASNKKWVDEGVDQAHCYAKERGTVAYVLCCFDMRKAFTGQTCFDHVYGKASRLDVALRCWHLFSSAKDYRAHKTAV